MIKILTAITLFACLLFSSAVAATATPDEAYTPVLEKTITGTVTSVTTNKDGNVTSMHVKGVDGEGKAFDEDVKVAPQDSTTQGIINARFSGDEQTIRVKKTTSGNFKWKYVSGI